MDLPKLIERFLQGIFCGWLFWVIFVGFGIYAIAVSGWVIIQNLWPYMLGAAVVWLVCHVAWKHHKMVKAARQQPTVIDETPACTRYPQP